MERYGTILDGFGRSTSLSITILTSSVGKSCIFARSEVDGVDVGGGCRFGVQRDPYICPRGLKFVAFVSME